MTKTNMSLKEETMISENVSLHPLNYITTIRSSIFGMIVLPEGEIGTEIPKQYEYSPKLEKTKSSNSEQFSIIVCISGTAFSLSERSYSTALKNKIRN